jgi:hypothetical protein
MYGPPLPPTLLDLISLRASMRSNAFNLRLVTTTKGRSLLHAALNSRHMHQATLAMVMPQRSADVGEVSQSMYSRSVSFVCCNGKCIMIEHNRRNVRRRREGALSVRTSQRPSTSISELERRVQALQSTAVDDV